MKKFKKILAEVLEVPEESILSTSSPDTIPSWDSMKGLFLVTKLETEYNVNFTLDEVLSVKKVSDIMLVLETRGIIFDEQV